MHPVPVAPGRGGGDDETLDARLVDLEQDAESGFQRQAFVQRGGGVDRNVENTSRTITDQLSPPRGGVDRNGFNIDAKGGAGALAPPRGSRPVGEGAKRVRTGEVQRRRSTSTSARVPSSGRCGPHSRKTGSTVPPSSRTASARE